MSLIISLVIGLIIIGFVLWLVKLLPIDETIKKIIIAVIVLAVVLWVLNAALALFGYGGLGPLFGPGGPPRR